MSPRSFREPGQPPPKEPPIWLAPHQNTGMGRPPRRDVVARLVARAVAAAETKDNEAGGDRP